MRAKWKLTDRVLAPTKKKQTKSKRKKDHTHQGDFFSFCFLEGDFSIVVKRKKKHNSCGVHVRSLISQLSALCGRCPACKPLSAPSALSQISDVLRDSCLDNADLCGRAPCAFGPGWMDTCRALFPDTDEFVKWTFSDVDGRGVATKVEENIQRAGPIVNVRLWINSLHVAVTRFTDPLLVWLQDEMIDYIFLKIW